MAIIPIMPAGGFSTLRKNIMEAKMRGMCKGMATPTTYYWFYQRVRNRGPWDYKQKNRSWADFGNFNFGATGYVAGIPPEILLMGAGFAQSMSGTSRPSWGHWYGKLPHGDDPIDQKWIKQGIDYARQHGY
ncbi:polymorphic toxin type 44 domain-containing protein [Edaphovirga cremea]|uniref:polymorphic toxin type 44 domain-containing protein n=1 Tax=Edaphovirga cremea TaxID=2267246 RepID=UPI003988CD8F